MRTHSAVEKHDRVASVDALRGFSMIWLVGGEGAALALGEMLKSGGPLLRGLGNIITHQFEHAPWQGFRFWDLVFPLFIFVTGIAVVFALSDKKADPEQRRKAYGHIVIRAAVLFLLGVLFYGGAGEPWPEIRLAGVLQRIALCYLFAALLFMHLQWRGIIAVIAVVLIGYWILLTFVPVPGLGVATYQNDVNLANWIDRNYLPGKKFDGLTDPEGLLSTLPAIATCLFGVLAGLFLQYERVAPVRKAYTFMMAGIALLLIGYVWGLEFPIIKAIWTSSFVLVTAGYSAVLLGAFYLVMDVWGHQRWATVFKWIGTNALFLYFINGVAGFEPFAKRLVGGSISQFFDQAIAPGAGRFVLHCVALLIAIALARYLYKRRIFIRV